MKEKKSIVTTDNWSFLHPYTAARIALGRAGVSMPANALLQFKMSHAHARDAVFSELKKDVFIQELNSLRLPFVLLQSKAVNRHVYLKRPDLGRRLDEASLQTLSVFANEEYDVCINIADGLSAAAINNHALPVIKLLLKKLHKQQLRIAPICLIEQGRVAISDETGLLLHAKLSVIFIGERPGLSSPDSMGVYLTYAPQPGLTDEKRNCVSNIHREGLPYEEAANTIFYLLMEALRLKLSGIALKDESEATVKIDVDEANEAGEKV